MVSQKLLDELKIIIKEEYGQASHVECKLNIPGVNLFGEAFPLEAVSHQLTEQPQIHTLVNGVGEANRVHRLIEGVAFLSGTHSVIPPIGALS